MWGTRGSVGTRGFTLGTQRSHYRRAATQREIGNLSLEESKKAIGQAKVSIQEGKRIKMILYRATKRIFSIYIAKSKYDKRVEQDAMKL